MLKDSLTKKLDDLNSLLNSVEAYFQQNRTVASAWVTAESGYHAGILKWRGKWRLCAAGPMPADELTDESWKPATDCCVDARLAAVKLFDALEREIERVNAEVEAEIEAANNTISEWIQGRSPAVKVEV